MVSTVYCKQRIVQLYFQRRVSYQNVVNVLKAEGITVSKKTVYVTIQNYKKHGTISRLPGSGRRHKRQNYSHSAYQIAGRSRVQNLQIYHPQSEKDTGLDVSRKQVLPVDLEEEQGDES